MCYSAIENRNYICDILPIIFSTIDHVEKLHFGPLVTYMILSDILLFDNQNKIVQLITNLNAKDFISMNKLLVGKLQLIEKIYKQLGMSLIQHWVNINNTHIEGVEYILDIIDHTQWMFPLEKYKVAKWINKDDFYLVDTDKLSLVKLFHSNCNFTTYVGYIDNATLSVKNYIIISDNIKKSEITIPSSVERLIIADFNNHKYNIPNSIKFLKIKQFNNELVDNKIINKISSFINQKNQRGERPVFRQLNFMFILGICLFISIKLNES